MTLAICGTELADHLALARSNTHLRVACAVLKRMSVAARARDEGDRIDVLMFLLWAGGLLFLLRYA